MSFSFLIRKLRLEVNTLYKGGRELRISRATFADGFTDDGNARLVARQGINPARLTLSNLVISEPRNPDIP